jgi:hypothetical protein
MTQTYPEISTEDVRRAVPTTKPHVPIPALTGLLLLAVLGGWLIVAPFALGTQDRGAAWTHATRTDVTVGALLTGIAVATLLGHFAATLAWIVRYRG